MSDPTKPNLSPSVALGGGAAVNIPHAEGQTPSPSGSLNAEGSLGIDNGRIAITASTNFSSFSPSLLGAYVPEWGEIGASIGGTIPGLFNISGSAYLEYTGISLFDDKLATGPGFSVAIGYTDPGDAPEENPDNSETHEHQTSYCGDNGAEGTFANDEGVGGCQNRPTNSIPRSTPLPPAPGFVSGISVYWPFFATLYEDKVIEEVNGIIEETVKGTLSLEIFPTVSINFTEPVGISASILGMLRYGF